MNAISSEIYRGPMVNDLLTRPVMGAHTVGKACKDFVQTNDEATIRIHPDLDVAQNATSKP
jgi:hypothetical protein